MGDPAIHGATLAMLFAMALAAVDRGGAGRAAR